MSRRPTATAPAFGKWLEERRRKLTGRRKALEWVASQIRPLVGLKVNRSSLSKIESGQIPNWPTLVALCRVYGVPLDDAVKKLTAALTFPGSENLIRPTDGQTGQEIGRSELHTSADLRVNSQGTQRAKRTTSTHGNVTYASSGSADRRPTSPVQVAARLYDLAHDLYERADELERLADTLLSSPPGAEAPSDRHGSSAIDPDLRAHGGSPARTPPRGRRAG